MPVSNRRSRFSFIPVGLGLVAGLSASSSTRADEIAWINPTGGSYQNPNNWENGQVPGSNDDAIFDLAAAYPVDFLADHPTRQLRLLDGEVSMDMGAFVFSLELGLVVSGLGNGTGPILTITGGTLASGESTVATEVDSVGCLVVSGATWQLSSRLTVGDFGAGVVAFADGATAVFNDSLVLAAQPGSTGDVTLDGASTSLANPTLFVGQLGSGTMCVTGGASFAAPFRSGWIGNLAGSSGSVVVTGKGSSFVSELRYVGVQGSGSLFVSQGGCATLTANELTMADDVGSNAEIAVIGAGSLCDVDGRIWLFGESLIRVESGGRLDIASVVSALPAAGTLASVIVDGIGSALDANTMSIGGGDGQATLCISGGAVLTNNNDADVRGHGLATVTGEGSLWDFRTISCGDSSGATPCIEIRDGAAACSLFDGVIAEQTDYRGEITVAGDGSRWDVNRNLFVGGESAVLGAPGQGTLTVTDAATVVVGNLYFQRVGGLLVAGLSPASPVHVQVGAEASLDGTLGVLLQDGFRPPFGAEFDILTATVVQGEFAAVVQPKHVTFEVVYEPEAVRLRVVSPFGDLDGDGLVGFSDLLIVLGAWGDCPEECPADLDGDGTVGFGDILLILANWG